MKYEAKLWTKLLRKVEQYLPVRFSYTPPDTGSHPWKIQPVWQKAKDKKKYGHWRGIITPGLVNGIPAFIKMIYKEAPFEAQERIRLDAIKNKKPPPEDTDVVKVYLDEDAEIKFVLRKIGSDATPDSVSGNANTGGITGVFEKVPEFFKRLGVRDANPKIGGEVPDVTRLLRACDVSLNQPRVGMINTATISAAAIDTTLVSINPAFTIPTEKEPSVTASTKYVTFDPPNFNFSDLIFQRFIDTPIDRFHLSTFYLLSPELPLLNTDDLENWQPYIKYNCHYNLVHATQQIERREEFVPLTLTIPLAGGLAQPVINYILAENNFFAQAALDFYQQRKLNGRFYVI